MAKYLENENRIGFVNLYSKRVTLIVWECNIVRGMLKKLDEWRIRLRPCQDPRSAG